MLTGTSDKTARLWRHEEERIRAEIDGWHGCEKELEEVAEELARYNELQGRTSHRWGIRLLG